MFSYDTYDLGLCSDLPLPELVAGERGADVIVRVGSLGHHSGEYGPIKCLKATAEEAYLSWGNVGTALVQNGREIVIDPFPGVEEQVLRLLILGAALGVLLHQRGLLVLHASAVAINGGVVAFIGRKGWGKSTMAAALHQRGHSIVTDDILALDIADRGELLVLPGFPQFKLWPDAAAALGHNPAGLSRLHPQFEKRAYCVSSEFVSTSLSLRRIYVLEGGASLKLEPLQSQEAFIELIRHSYATRFLGNAGVTITHFQQCVRLANNVSISRLKRHSSLSALSKTAKLVEEDLARDPA